MDEGRMEEIVRELVGEGVCEVGVALVGVGIEGGNGALVRRGVLEGGVDLNGEVWGGDRSITHSIRCGDSAEVVEALIEGGAEVNWCRGLHLRSAAAKGRVGVCGALLRGGADVNGVDGVGDTALHDAAWKGQQGVCEFLVASGANVGAVNMWNKTAAARARDQGHEAVAKYLEGLT